MFRCWQQKNQVSSRRVAKVRREGKVCVWGGGAWASGKGGEGISDDCRPYALVPARGTPSMSNCATLCHWDIMSTRSATSDSGTLFCNRSWSSAGLIRARTLFKRAVVSSFVSTLEAPARVEGLRVLLPSATAASGLFARFILVLSMSLVPAAVLSSYLASGAFEPQQPYGQGETRKKIQGLSGHTCTSLRDYAREPQCSGSCGPMSDHDHGLRTRVQ